MPLLKLNNECKLPTSFIDGSRLIFFEKISVGAKIMLFSFDCDLEGNISILRIGGMTMQVTKIINNKDIPNKEKHQYTEEELQHEYDYIRAEQMTKKLLKNGLITEDEFNKIMILNRQSFSPNLVEIMP